MFTTSGLSIAIFLPILWGILVLLIGRDYKAQFTKLFALAGAILSFLVTLPLYWNFNSGTHVMQFQEKHAWIESFQVMYHLGIDGISLWLILLTALITIIVVLAGWKVIEKGIAQYLGSFLILSGLMIGVFAALDAILFYVFFEATLIPMYIIIGIWGGPRRVYAAFKFFLYTLLGSLLMLVALGYLRVLTNSFSILDWQAYADISLNEQILLFMAFFMAFAVKVPMWPVHTWLPDAHVEAPTGGSVVLAAIMLKLGAYGFLRFSIPILPDASAYLQTFMITLSLVAVVYIGLVALVQEDMKKLVAYSSVAHMGFVTLGFFLFNAVGMEGAIAQMISHGFVSGAMFLCIGVLYDRLHTREMKDYGGVVNVMPRFAVFFVLFSMANAGLPGTSGFIGEFMVILGAIQYGFWIGLLAATALILGAAYSLLMVKRVLYGAVRPNSPVESMQDLCRREFGILAAMAVLVIAMGLHPKPITDTIHSSVVHLLEQAHVSKVK